MDQTFTTSRADDQANPAVISLGVGGSKENQTPNYVASPPNNSDDQMASDNHRGTVVGAPPKGVGKVSRATRKPDAGSLPDQHRHESQKFVVEEGETSRQKDVAPRTMIAGALPSPQGDERHSAAAGKGKKSARRSSTETPAGSASEEVLPGPDVAEAPIEAAEEDTRFADPLVLEIREMWRMRRRWLKARNALILQAKAFGRALSDGDKEQGTKIFEKVVAGTSDHPLAILAMSPFITGIERFEDELTKIERSLAKLAKKLPVAPWALSVRGFGFPSLAAIVGECGDLSAYRTISGVWKRAGLAVIDGDGRQRRIADAEKALIHGYSPERRSALWNVAEPMARLQRTWLDKETGEIKKAPDPYGVILEREKAKALEAGCTPAHAEARAKRHMTKKFLRDLTAEWRRVAGRGDAEEMKGTVATSPPPEPYPIAAE